MRRALAGALDAVLGAILAYLGFRFALWATPCGGNLADCFPLAPAIVLCVLIALTLYFGLGHLTWRTTPGQRLFQAEGAREDDLP